MKRKHTNKYFFFSNFSETCYISTLIWVKFYSIIFNTLPLDRSRKEEQNMQEKMHQEPLDHHLILLVMQNITQLPLQKKQEMLWNQLKHSLKKNVSHNQLW
jgi:hypothetical protein